MWQPVVSSVTVGCHHPLSLAADVLSRRLGVARVEHLEGRHVPCGVDPQPLPPPALPPARLVHVLRHLPPDEAVRLLHRRAHRFADLPLDGSDAARREREAVEHRHGFRHVAVAQARPPRQVADHGLRPRPESTRGTSRRAIRGASASRSPDSARRGVGTLSPRPRRVAPQRLGAAPAEGQRRAARGRNQSRRRA